ncbi:uncharacterized protein ACNS7B_012138 isoform 2-T2 [Menidia menidia]
MSGRNQMKRRMSPWGPSFGSGRSSDSAAMASGPPDSMINQEAAEVQEECSGKKKSKFQTFKKLFARKKRKEPSAPEGDAGLKASHSSDNVSKTSENNKLTRAEKEKGSGSKISLGGKALSHDSVFVSDSSETHEALEASQDSINGKVKSLQLQLKQAIKLGSPPSLLCVKKTEDAGTMSEDDGLPCSPPEYTSLHSAMRHAQRNSSNSLHEMDSDDEQLSRAASSRAMSPLVVPGDFSQPASPFGCLDNSAAKHKLGLRHKACNKRKPASHLLDKVERDSAVLNISIQEEDAGVPEEQQGTEESADRLQPKVEREEDEDEEGTEKRYQQDSRRSLLRDKDESDEEQDVSHSPDTSCPPMLSLSEEEVPDDRPLPCSKTSSRTSSLESPRATPEPFAGPKEYLLDPTFISHKLEDTPLQSYSSSEEDDVIQEGRDEESSLLEEVLSSLKTPLGSSSLETEEVVLELEETDDAEAMAETEESAEIKGEEDEAEEPVCRQTASPCSTLSSQTSEEEEGAGSSSFETVAAVERIKDGKEEGGDEVEDRAIGRFAQDSDEEEEEDKEYEGKEAEEAEPEEENNILTRETVVPESEEEEDGKGEEEKEEKEIEEDHWENIIADNSDEKLNIEEEEEIEEKEEEVFSLASQDQEVQSDCLQEAEEEEAVGDVTERDMDDQISPEEGDQVLPEEQGQENLNQNSGGESNDREEMGQEADLIEEKSEEEQEEEDITTRPDVDQTEKNPELENERILTLLDPKGTPKDPDEAAEQSPMSKPSPLSLPETPETRGSSPSKTSSLQVTLASPTSEKTTPLFQPSSASREPGENGGELPPVAEVAPVHGERASEKDNKEEEKRSTRKQEPADEEVVTPSPDKGKIRFTIAPAWQRSQSLTPPPSPPACVSSSTKPAEDEAEAVAENKEQIVKRAEPAGPQDADEGPSPDRARNGGSSPVKTPSSTAPLPLKADPCFSTPPPSESSVVAEGNPDNPFGVRLRKTSALFRFGSEEENAEPPVESPSQPTCTAETPPQPVSSKPSVCPPVSNKPALPKKPEVHGEAGSKPRRVSDPVTGRGSSGVADPPSWISMAKQKQKIYKENSLDEITIIKEEHERKSSLPAYVSSAASREQSNKTAQSPSKAGQTVISKPPVSVEKETRRALSPPTPVPPQPSKPQQLPCPVAPKPQMLPAVAKPPPQPGSPQRNPSPPTPVPVASKPSPTTTPSYLSKTATPSKTPPVTSPPFSSRVSPEKPGSRGPGTPGLGPSSPALPQDEPPWMALAKKKAKAWSEMPQIVQ